MKRLLITACTAVFFLTACSQDNSQTASDPTPTTAATTSTASTTTAITSSVTEKKPSPTINPTHDIAQPDVIQPVTPIENPRQYPIYDTSGEAQTHHGCQQGYITDPDLCARIYAKYGY